MCTLESPVKMHCSDYSWLEEARNHKKVMYATDKWMRGRAPGFWQIVGLHKPRHAFTVKVHHVPPQREKEWKCISFSLCQELAKNFFSRSSFPSCLKRKNEGENLPFSSRVSSYLAPAQSLEKMGRCVFFFIYFPSCSLTEVFVVSNSTCGPSLNFREFPI